MKIGELAKSTGTPIETIRYYERVGLLPAPARTASNYRRYTEPHARRLSFVRRCRVLDMSLEEIRALLAFCDDPARNCEEANALLDEHIEHVQARLAELDALATELRALRRVCRAPGRADTCRILQALRSTDGAARRRPGRAGTHGRGVHER